MKSNKYWSNRQAWNMYHQMDLSEQTADEIAKLYLKASRWLTLQSMEIFEKFMDKHGLTEAEARILLNTLQDKNDINRLIQILKSSASTPEKKEIIRKLEAPAYGARIERLRQLQNQLDQLMTNVYHQELVKSTAHYVDLANEAYYRTMFEIQQRAGYGFSFNHISRKQIDRVLQMNWSGKHYSKRIWKNTKALADDLKEELLLSLVTGRTDRETAHIIQNKFASGAMQARRLVRTESCFVSGELTAKAYEECGIEKYRYVATLDLRTSLVCRDLDGQEFYLSERKTGKNYPPMHPWCRSTTIAAPTAKELATMKRRAFDPETGKHILVPASMTYKEWYKKYVRGSEKALAQENAVRNKASDRKQYEQYKEIMKNDIPDSIEKFLEMKYNEPEIWKYTRLDYRRRMDLKKHPENILPGIDHMVIDNRKFTEYLFDSSKPRGWAKGQAYISRLGYTADNWENLRDEIKKRAEYYTAKPKGITEFGKKYEQRMVIYGLKNTPANVEVGWILKTDGTLALTSAYINEVKIDEY